MNRLSFELGGTRKRRAVAALLFVLCTSGSLCGEALAADPPPIERARDQFRAGAAAYAAGDYLAAIDALGKAYELTPMPAIAFSLAQAERKQYLQSQDPRHLQRSLQLFALYLEQVPNGGRRADAQDALTQLSKFTQPTDVPQDVRETPTRVMVTSEAEGARAAIDGGDAALLPLIREVTPGEHDVLVTAPGYYPHRRKVRAFEGELMLKEVELEERPSVLVLSTPEECDVYIDGNYVSPGGPASQIQVPSGNHRITVTKNGYQAKNLEVRTLRGAATPVKVSLEPTTQRTTALGLFIGGGALLGGSVVLNAFRIRAENRAESFLLTQSTRNIASDELLRYRAIVAERDRWGIASAVALASAGGLFISGLFLHELDQPDLGRVPGADTWPRERTPVQLNLGAWSTGEASGGMLYGQF